MRVPMQDPVTALCWDLASENDLLRDRGAGTPRIPPASMWEKRLAAQRWAVMNFPLPSQVVRRFMVGLIVL